MTTCAGAEPGNGKPVCIQSDRLEGIEERQRSLAVEQADAVAELIAMRRTLGTAPNAATGDAGSGMAMVLSRLATAILDGGGPHRPVPTLAYDDEGEDTRIQDRRAILARAKAAESQERTKRVALIVSVIIAAIGLAGNVYQVTRHSPAAPSEAHP